LAGGDKASKEPIRPLLGLLMQAYDKEFDLNKLQWLLEPIEPDKAKQEIICEQIRKKVNVVQSSSLGRIFDAVASILGLGKYNHFEAQLPMLLEAIADPNCDSRYDFELAEQSDKHLIFDLRIMLKQIINEINGVNQPAIISAKFHNTIAAGLLGMAKAAKRAKGLNIVALSGGVFCNKFLIERLVRMLKNDGFTVLFNRDFPANDGCISVGQAAIAARRVMSH
jgi:hydrogenase maturation protein HypF